MAKNAALYQLRVNQPGYGPKIVTCLLSDLDPISPATQSDLWQQPAYFQGSGAPAAGTLLAGNYNAAKPLTGYLVGDLYSDTNGAVLYLCTTAGSNATSVWKQISGSGGGFKGYYNPANAYSQGDIINVPNTFTVALGLTNVTVLAGTYGCLTATAANPTNAVQYPQFPLPTGACWVWFAPGIVNAGQCGNSANNYAASTIPLS
jgi:hypothetical protein